MKLETVVLNRERNVTLRAYLLDTPADYENIDKAGGDGVFGRGV